MLEVMHAIDSCGSAPDNKHRVMKAPDGKPIWQPFARLGNGRFIYQGVCGQCGLFFSMLVSHEPDVGQADAMIVDRYLKDIEPKAE